MTNISNNITKELPVLTIPQTCTACRACEQICPHEAVRMQIDENGFLHPNVVADICTGCKTCEKVCPALHNDDSIDEKQNVYLAWIKDTDTRLSSSSGGLFSAIADYVLLQGGIVCGAMYDNEMNVVHGFATNAKELEKLRGSKYVQSDTNNTFTKTKQYLKQGLTVYYTGTPCQIAGLKKFLQKDYDNLLTSDLICHGVPSNTLFRAQIKSMEQSGKKITNVNFRSKKRFGQGYDFQIVTELSENHNQQVRGQSKFYNAELVPYFYGFWENITLRECCYTCKYCTQSRQGDITLADYWTAKRDFPHIKISKGLSLILVNTDKGRKVFEQIKPNIEYKQSSIENALRGQGHLSHPVKMPKRHLRFVEDYSNNTSFDKLTQTILKVSTKEAVKYRLRNFIKLAIFYKYWK
jgi:coenzyme F420-reducing hydrogenase beta subunit